MAIEATAGANRNRHPARPARRLALAIGLVAVAAVVITLDGPGLTVDEPLDVRPGRTYVETLIRHGWRFFEPAVVDRVFRDNAEHPPLGRWLLGIASTLGQPLEVFAKGGVPDPTGQYVLAGRLAPAMAFAVLAGTVSYVAARRWRLAAGAAAGFALLAMPRVFAHAHLAALDTFLSLFWTWAVLAGDRAIRSSRPILAMAGAGAVWSLALLSKIHAWFLLPILGVWCLINLPPRRALAAWAAWALSGIALFWLGWPWIWYDTWARLQGFWGTGVKRTPIMVQYFGAVFVDHDVPWHYPWFYFAVTVPIGLQALGAIGVFRSWKGRRDERLPLLLGATIVAFLGLFSTRVPVYDGERLFLLVFPAWALLIGRGFGWLWYDFAHDRRRRVLLAGLLLAQGYGTLALHPFGLSYYNALVGGLPGAVRLGLELTYWNDAVDQKLLDVLARRAEAGDTAALVPSLYPGQGILTTNRALWGRGLVLEDQEKALGADWLVVSRRTAYLRPEILRRLGLPEARRVAVRSRQGVWLGALWQFPRRKLTPSL
jgi:4-amino-4-deoxy-L-arabinose transferase-like glycosyltransferase